MLPQIVVPRFPRRQGDNSVLKISPQRTPFVLLHTTRSAFPVPTAVACKNEACHMALPPCPQVLQPVLYATHTYTMTRRREKRPAVAFSPCGCRCRRDPPCARQGRHRSQGRGVGRKISWAGCLPAGGRQDQAFRTQSLPARPPPVRSGSTGGLRRTRRSKPTSAR